MQTWLMTLQPLVDDEGADFSKCPVVLESIKEAFQSLEGSEWVQCEVEVTEETSSPIDEIIEVSIQGVDLGRMQEVLRISQAALTVR